MFQFSFIKPVHFEGEKSVFHEILSPAQVQTEQELVKWKEADTVTLHYTSLLLVFMIQGYSSGVLCK